MASATAERSTTKSEVNPIHQYLVWYGTLPASQPVDTYVNERERNPETNEFYRIVKQNPHNMWSPKIGPRVWVGKCRAFQSIGVKGFVFPAFSEAVDFSSSDETRNVSAPFPGALQLMTKEEIDRIVFSCNKFIVRYGNMMGDRDIYSVSNSSSVSILDLEQGDRHPQMTEAEYTQLRRVAPVDRVFFNSATDFLVSEFVYLLPIKVENLDSIHKMNGRKKILDINACIQYLPNQRLDERFFTSPPKSVAEAFPQGK